MEYLGRRVCFLVHAGMFLSCVLHFRRFVSSCPSVLLSGGESQNLLILVSCCKFICSPALAPVCAPLVLISKGNILLGTPPNFQPCHLHAWHTSYCERQPGMNDCELICTCLTGTCSLSPLWGIHIVYQVDAAPHRFPAVSLVLCPSFKLPVPSVTPDQGANYGCWHEPPCNLKSTSLRCLAPSLCLESCRSSPSIQLDSPPPCLLPLFYLYMETFLLIGTVWYNSCNDNRTLSCLKALDCLQNAGYVWADVL